MTVIDDDDEDTWVNVVASIEEGYFSQHSLQGRANIPSALDEGESFKASCAEQPDIPRKPAKLPEPAETNGHNEQDGDGDVIVEEGAPKTLKRSNPEEGDQPTKKAKISASKGDNAIVIEDAGGAIVIDDD